MSRHVDFITGRSPERVKEKSKRLSLSTVFPKLDNCDTKSVIQTIHSNVRKIPDNEINIEDGLYVSAEGPLTNCVVKPYQLDHQRTIQLQKGPVQSKKLLEIAIREVIINADTSQTPLTINSIQILYKDKLICKISSPFNRKLYKILINNTSGNTNNLSLRLQAKNCMSLLPFPLPAHCVREKLIQIDFSITNNTLTYSGTLFCTVSLSMRDSTTIESPTPTFKSTNDPNDPQNSLSNLKIKKKAQTNINYFELTDSSLTITPPITPQLYKSSTQNPHNLPPKLVILEQTRFSLWDLSLGSFLEARRPLRPVSGTHKLRSTTARAELLTITILRGVEMPIREESSLIQPLIRVQWGETVHCTTVAEGTSPVWQQTLQFGMPNSVESVMKLSLYDQHPVWGQQWLGEATIPLECSENYQEIERWIGLSALNSPVHRFGYIQATPGSSSHTRIYVLIKMERLLENDSDKGSLDTLAKAIQRCLVQPYKIAGTETPDDAAKLTMLLTGLPVRYGPLTPRQALKLNKIDYYGRTALLASLLQGLGLEASVVLGNSQARRWAAFVMTSGSSSGDDGPKFWDPDNGDQFSLGDTRCPLNRIMRVINHQNIWRNLQRASILTNVRFNLKSTKEWQALGNITTVGTREVQLLEIPQEVPDVDESIEIENDLKEKLSVWRRKMGFTTIFNRHAAAVLREFLRKLNNSHSDDSEEVLDNKNDFKQLNRIYYIHGFIVNLRYGPRDELIDLFASTKIQDITGPIEFALICQVQRYIGKTMSLWLAIVVLRSRD